MLYNPPTGAVTVNDGYVGKNVSAGIIGSKLPPKAAEAPQREIVNGILAASLSPTNGDMTQLAQAMSIGLWLGPMGGSANALADTLPTLATTSDGVTQFAIPSLQPGMTFHGIVAATNTGPATLTLTGFGTAPGAKPIFRKDGSPVQAGDLPAGAAVTFKWDGAGYRVMSVVQSDILALIAANAGVVRVTDAAAASTAQALSGTASPAISAYSPSQVFIFTAGANNTAANPTLNVTSAGGLALGTLTIVKRDASALAQGDLVAGATYIGSPDPAGAKLRLFGQFPSDTAAQLVTSPDPASLLYNAEFLICQGNYDFPVNGVPTTSFTLSQGQVVYDGWRGGAGGCTITIGTNGFITVAGVIEQVVEAPAVAGETLTICFDDVSGAPLPVTLTDGTNGVSGVVPVGAGTQSATLVVPAAQTGNLVAQIGGANTTITWRRPRLIRGNAPRAYIRRLMSEDLLNCQRYFCMPGRTVVGERRVDPTTIVNSPIGVGQALSANTAQIFVPFPVYMYRKPTLEVVNPGTFSLGNAAGTTASTCSAISLGAIGTSKNGAFLNVTLTNSILTAGQATYMYFTSGSCRLFFHAEP